MIFNSVHIIFREHFNSDEEKKHGTIEYKLLKLLYNSDVVIT